MGFIVFEEEAFNYLDAQLEIPPGKGKKAIIN